MLAAAMMFRRADVPPAKQAATLRLPKRHIETLLPLKSARDQIGLVWKGTKVSSETLARCRIATQLVDKRGKPTIATSSDPSGEEVVKWNTHDPQGALFTVNAPATKAIVGLVANRRVELGPWAMQFGDATNRFAASTLTAVDGKPVNQSSRLVLVCVGRAGNTGMQWRADRRMLASWGHGPALAEAVPATVSLRTVHAAWVVFALDGKGNRVGRVEATFAKGRVAFRIGPEHKTIWYELRARTR